MSNKCYTKSDVISLYEELKDVRLEDYLDEEGKHLIGAVALPIDKKACDLTCQVIDLFDKDIFALFPNSPGYCLSARRKFKDRFAHFSIFSDKAWYFIYNNKTSTWEVKETIDYNIPNSLVDGAKHFISEVNKRIEKEKN